jgi:hypothetical protein
MSRDEWGLKRRLRYQMLIGRSGRHRFRQEKEENDSRLMYTPVHCNVIDVLINYHFWATLHHEGARLGRSPAWLLHQRALGRPPSVIYPRNDRGRHSGRFLNRYVV